MDRRLRSLYEMEQLKALSEHFHRSRLTSMVMSTLAFTVSVIDQKKLADLELLGVKVGALNRNFLLFALSLAAFVSLISLWLAFWNEGLSHLRNAKADYNPDSYPLPTLETTDNVLEQARLASLQIEDLLKSDELKRAIATGPLQLNASKIVTLMDFVPAGMIASAFNVVRERSEWLHSIPATSPESIDWIASEVEMAITSTIENYMRGVANELITSNSLAWDGPSIDRMASEAKGVLAGASTNIKNLARQIERYRRSLRFSQFTHQAETGWIGVGVPTILFIVAGLHSWGAAVWWWWPTLPSLFE